MTATVHPIPTATHALSLARQVSRNHVCYETLDLIAARSVLLDCGAGHDMQVAEMLRHVIRDRIELEDDDTPRANRLADAVTMFVLGSAGLMLLAMWWLA
jgi:hypothetical protein